VSVSEQSKNSKVVSIADAVLEASHALRIAGVAEARREAGSLLAHVLGKDRTFIISHARDELNETTIEEFAAAVRRRALGEPQQYITGTQNFYGLEFAVNPDVLIPRPETELLVEATLKLINEASVDSQLICDVGTGSGCIAITLVYHRPEIKAVAVDISERAIRVALANAKRHNATDRVSLVVSDAFSAMRQANRFDVIVSNPPYVSASALAGLQREVREHEPHLALSPGGDGLSIIQKLITESPAYLKSGGYLLFEIGFDQHEAVNQMVNPHVWRLLEIQPDLQGIPRIVALQKLP
jgi:release factor glutamine methyltransferase